jgi:hypothetical protein
MNFATFTIASVVALGAFANAEEVARTSGETNPVIALAAAERAPQTRASHDELTGLYRTPNGESFFVEEKGEGLTVALPASLGTEPLELTAESDGHVFVAGDATRVVFERNESGRVMGLRFFKPNTEVVTAAKTTPHGIVLIYDVPRRGIVKVYDIT